MYSDYSPPLFLSTPPHTFFSWIPEVWAWVCDSSFNLDCLCGGYTMEGNSFLSPWMHQ